MSDYSVGLSDVRKKLIEDIRVSTKNVQNFMQHPMTNINSTEIGDRLGRGDIHPSSSTASSL